MVMVSEFTYFIIIEPTVMHVFAILITCGYGLMDYDYTEDNTDKNKEYLLALH